MRQKQKTGREMNPEATDSFFFFLGLGFLKSSRSGLSFYFLNITNEQTNVKVRFLLLSSQFKNFEINQVLD